MLPGLMYNTCQLYCSFNVVLVKVSIFVMNDIFIPNREIGRFSFLYQKSGDLPNRETRRESSVLYTLRMLKCFKIICNRFFQGDDYFFKDVSSPIMTDFGNFWLIFGWHLLGQYIGPN